MIDDVFSVIADPTRRQILRALSSGKHSVGELVGELGVSQPTVSKHLKVLRLAGLVETEAAGQKRYYSLTPAPLHKVTLWIEALSHAHATSQSESETSEDRQDAPSTAAEEAANAAVVEADAAADIDPILEVGEKAATEDEPEPVKTEDAEPAVADEPADSSADESVAEESQAEEPEAEESQAEESEEPEATYRARHSSSAISYTPLMPFTPGGAQQKVEEEEEQAEEAPVDETPAVETLAVETLADHAPVEQSPSTDENPENAADSAESQVEESPVEEPQEVTAAERDPEPTPDVQTDPAADAPPELPSAENHYDTHESRGLIASLTRWGRRRSR
ncbi:metalloregulator ArsR/SmtB family transcription factor [Rothia sp. LK2588]|uniref:metalloregulator ArsR/SmtB family transcription factor n=1 Tax=Rothia sp. LK2588 TaxID=3114369 RepID=UPI0034CF236B